MSIDKSLKRKGAMGRSRCVLKRSERILKMLEDGRYPDGRSPFGLPKTRVQKVVLKKKKVEKAAEGGEAAAAGTAVGAAAVAAPPAAEAAGAKKK